MTMKTGTTFWKVIKSGSGEFGTKIPAGSHGYDFKWLVERVASQLGLGPQEVLAPGKYP